MPSPPLVVIHERIGYWHRRLRPKCLAVEPSLRWVESRSGADLGRALAGSVAPIVLIDVGQRLLESLNHLDQAISTAPNALALVLDPLNHEGLAILARELGASQVVSGPAPPVEVFALIRRWLPISRRRGETSGWAEPVEPEPEPWENPEAFARRWLSTGRRISAR